MVAINSILHLTRAELETAGISYRTAEKWQGWQKLPTNGKVSIYPVAQLKDKYLQQLHQHYGDLNQYYANTKFQSFIAPDYKALEYFRTYKLDNGKGLPEEYIKQQYTACQWLNFIITATGKEGKHILKQIGMSKGELMTALTSDYAKQDGKLIEVRKGLLSIENIDLPKGYTALQKFKNNYLAQSYELFISDKFCNKNSEKITIEIGEWLIANYALPVKMNTAQLLFKYRLKAAETAWENLSEQAIYNFLHKEENQIKWYGERHGYKLAAQKFGIRIKTEMPTMRDSLWYSDGTKVNLYYLDVAADGKTKMLAKLNVYEVMDAFSEVFLGCYINEKAEHFAGQAEAFKDALRFSQHKPYELRYDNQGGHKKLTTGNFLNVIAHLSHRTKPYNPQSKTIESAFGRFQQQILKGNTKYWMFTGMNNQAKALDSKVNIEFILANQKNLLSREETVALYLEARAEWNNMPHHKYGKPRLELYRCSHNAEAQPISVFDMVDMFWITNPQPIKYYSHGIQITINKEKHHFEVYDENGMPCLEFRSKYMDAGLIVKYDADDLSHIRLYTQSEQGLQEVGIAQPKVSFHRGTQEQGEGEKALINKHLAIHKEELESWKAEIQAIQVRTGISTGSMVQQSTISKKMALEAISEGEYEKIMSNKDQAEEEDSIWDKL
jgi:hypothetical protein